MCIDINSDVMICFKELFEAVIQKYVMHIHAHSIAIIGIGKTIQKMCIFFCFGD